MYQRSKRDFIEYKKIKDNVTKLKESVMFLRSKCEYSSPIITGETKSTVKNDYYTELMEKSSQLKEIEKEFVFATRRMLDIINSIKDKPTREVLKYKCIKGLSWFEISEETNYSVNYLKQKYYTFMKKLTD